MQSRASFLSFCAHSFMWWLLTNALGSALVYARFELLRVGMAQASASDKLGLALASFLVPWFIACYATLLWPVLTLLPQWWALSAQRPQARRGRLLLVVLGPFAVLATCQKLRLHDDELQFMGCYLSASLVSAAWMFRRWLW